MMQHSTLGWDIGGAHLKLVACDGQGKVCYAGQWETPLWKGLEYLEQTIKKIPTELLEQAAVNGLTMTGELADIFPDRVTGVDALVELLAKSISREKIRVYAGHKGWLNIESVAGNQLQVASANWHISSEMLRHNGMVGIFIDIGSTTSDIIPVLSRGLDNRGYSDFERLRSDELIYSGVIRTPVPTVVSQVPLAGQWQGIATEYFATMGDIYVLTGEITGENNFSTADGQGLDPLSCSRRVARLAGCDVNDFPPSEWQRLAVYIATQHKQSISKGISRVMSRYPDIELPLIGAGTGRFLVKKIAKELDYTYHDFAECLLVSKELQALASDYAPATACAVLCRTFLN